MSLTNCSTFNTVVLSSHTHARNDNLLVRIMSASYIYDGNTHAYNITHLAFAGVESPPACELVLCAHTYFIHSGNVLVSRERALRVHSAAVELILGLSACPGSPAHTFIIIMLVFFFMSFRNPKQTARRPTATHIWLPPPPSSTNVQL